MDLTTTKDKQAFTKNLFLFGQCMEGHPILRSLRDGAFALPPEQIPRYWSDVPLHTA
jgi:hypothetical protein